MSYRVPRSPTSLGKLGWARANIVQPRCRVTALAAVGCDCLAMAYPYNGHTLKEIDGRHDRQKNRQSTAAFEAC